MFVRRLLGVVALAGLTSIPVFSAQAEPHAPLVAVEAAQPAAASLPLAPPSLPAVVAPVAAAKPAAPPKPAITLQAKADLARQVLVVTENGRTIASWPISSGVEDHATPRGTFQPEWTAKMWYSHTYDNAPMPNAVFFKDGAAIHATQSTGALGRAASHGCVRLAPANAETFYRLVQRHGLAHTRISVFGTPNYQKSYIANRDTSATRRYAGAETRRDDGSIFGWGNLFAANTPPRLPISAARYR